MLETLKLRPILIFKLLYNMVKHVWSILCRKTIIDSATNNISLIDVFEQLQAKVSLPQNKNIKLSIPFEYEVVNFWHKENTTNKVEIDIEITLMDPNNKTLKTFTNIVTIPDNMKRMRTILKIIGIPITTSGIYRFIVKYKEKDTNSYKQVAELPIEIKIEPSINNKVSKRISN
ncbi:hypothetical protein CO083_06385 [Candidatus Roizmanbacteria bacterium CG_4_9_14_0_8_um_filter_34_12]|uniref:Uncharacterized protein n=1 Tax=Candidatus Roizmanbacteria bacterium CG_4_9_14_0_8_um_filter_34_12 TaxID=1974840 RepID=A0A2M8DAV3_9BACT|nr:MAG: hypothetical protein CO083_06385 [Candidatus Roizmanbacteria bacterium CG_4_9_14_0_8_um_filter_34_12]